MPEDSRFFELRDHSEGEFAEVLADMSTEGVYQHADQKLKVTAPGGLLVNVAAGRAMVQGFWYRLTAPQGISISTNPAGLTRYDRIVLRLDRGANRVILAVREGIPGSGPPALQRAIGGSWEISLAAVRVGPGATNIDGSTDLSDERGYASVCGWASGRGVLWPENIDGISNFIAISPTDPNTGLQWPLADRIDILAGAKPVATFSSTGNAIGDFDIVTTIRGGGTIGAPRERIYVDSDFILIGRDGSGANTGPQQIQVGTSPRVTHITVGHATSGSVFANIQISGVPIFTLPAVNNLMQFNVPDSYYTGFNIQNTVATKQFVLLLATGAAAGLGSAGDASIYTAGTAGGRLLLGTQGVARLQMSSTAMAFGYQVARISGFNFQQALNDSASGIRLYHTNGSSQLDWYSDPSGRHVWGINDVPSMWLFQNGVLTVGGTVATAPKGSGFNFIQYANASSWGIRVYHTNGTHNADLWCDDGLRLVLSSNDVPQMWASSGVITFGGSAARATGFNYQQTFDGVGYGYRLWHTNQSNRVDFGVDGGGRFVLAIQDNPRLHMHPNGAITLGAAPLDTAALVIPASFGDSPASGIRLTNAGGVGVWWCRSDGIGFFGSAVSQILFHHGTRAMTPDGDNVMSLGYAGYRWSNVVAHHGNFSGNLTVSGTISQGVGGSPTFADLTVTGMAHITNLTGAGTFGPVYPNGDGQVQFGANGRSWSDIFGTTFWKPGGGNGFQDTSDDRLKIPESFRPYDRGLEAVLALRPTYYQFTGEYGTKPNQEFVGFRAQELQQVVPEMVFTVQIARNAGAEEEEEPDDILAVNTGNLIYMLVNGMQEQQAQINELRSMVVAMQEGRA